MNKFFKGAMFVAVSGVLMLTCGCKPKPNGGEKKFDSETRVLQLSTSMLDGNFNRSSILPVTTAAYFP